MTLSRGAGRESLNFHIKRDSAPENRVGHCAGDFSAIRYAQSHDAGLERDPTRLRLRCQPVGHIFDI